MLRMALIGMAIFLAGNHCRGADPAAEVIVLRHRTSDQVLPLVQPLVPKPGTVSGTGNEIVVRTTRANLAEVQRVIEILDRAPRRLRVTVRQDADEDGGTAARVYGTRAADADQFVQQVQVLEGSEASIRIGQSVPVTLRRWNLRWIGDRFTEDPAGTVEFRDILSGFTVRPRLVGESVVLDLRPESDTPGDQGRGSMNVQRIGTTLAGRLGTWIEAGAVQSGQGAQRGAVSYGTRSASDRVRRILVKVDAAD